MGLVVTMFCLGCMMEIIRMEVSMGGWMDESFDCGLGGVNAGFVFG